MYRVYALYLYKAKFAMSTNVNAVHNNPNYCLALNVFNLQKKL